MRERSDMPNGETAPQDQDTTPEPTTPDALAILRGATACAPLEREEILGAFDTRDLAPYHVATILVAHCADRLDAVDAWSRLRRDRVKEEAVVGNESRATQDAAGYYNALFDQVYRLALTYNAQYHPDDRPNRNKLEALFDATDGTAERPAHPAIVAAETAFRETTHNRDRLGSANQLIRYMVFTSLHEEQSNQ